MPEKQNIYTGRSSSCPRRNRRAGFCGDAGAGDDAGPEGDRETPPEPRTLNIDIVSFERLAYRIFSELSLPQPEVLDDTGKNMVLRKLAGEKMDELTMFSSHLNRPGFISEIKSMLSELYQYGATPEDLKAQTAGEHVGQILAAKLSDMEVIFEAFREFTKEKYITLEELLDVLCRVADQSVLLKDSTMVLDGYTGFTPIQYRLIGILLKLCRNVFVTVSATMEPGEWILRQSRMRRISLI